MNKIIDVVFNRVANYFKYVMCVFAFISILGVLIPTKVLVFQQEIILVWVRML